MLTLPEYDYFEVAYPTSSTEVWTFRKVSGQNVLNVGNLTITYTDSTKNNILSGKFS